MDQRRVNRKIDPQLEAVVDTIRQHIKAKKYQKNHRLPPERELAHTLGLPRNRLRQAMSELEILGEVWRHVGKGTFVGRRRSQDESIQLIGLVHTNPDEIIEARLMFEPRLAATAALRGTDEDFDTLRALVAEGRETQDFEAGQDLNDQLHRAIAIATHSRLMLWMFDGLFAVRQATQWGKLRPIQNEVERLEVWAEHQTLVDTITSRDVRGAERCMYAHLDSLRKRILYYQG
jgi:DNA-binding FadR family transcriptional regulator